MKLPRVRFTIGRLMAAVAVIAILLAWVDVRVALALAGLSLVVISPATIAPPGRRLEAPQAGPFRSNRPSSYPTHSLTETEVT
jgi:hypothetical protein